MLWLRKREKEKTVAVVDIGSGSAGVAIVSLKLGAPAVILSSSRSALPIAERPREAAAWAISGRIIAAAHDALEAYGKEPAHAPIAAVYAIVHAPWTHAAVRRVEQRFDKDTIITQKMLAALGQEALHAADTAGSGGFFEASVVRVELNGYATSSPIGKEARHLRIAALTSTCDPDLYKAAEEALAGSFPDAPRIWRSSARAVVSALNAIEHHPKDAVVVEVGAEATDIIVVRKGTIAEQAVVSEGMHEILRRFGNSPAAETLDMLALLNQDRCDSGQCETMQASMARIEPELVHVFGEGFASLISSSARLPEQMFLIAHPDLAPWLARFFARIDFTQFSVTAQPFSTTAVEAQSLGHFVVPEGKSVPDANLALAVASVHIEHEA